MGGNLDRAKSTLERRPSSSMSSLNGRSPETVSQYTTPGRNKDPTLLKHRQVYLFNVDNPGQGHYRVSSKTSVPSSLQTTPLNGHSTDGAMDGANGLGISGLDAGTKDRHSEPGRNWLWNGLGRNQSLNHSGRHNYDLQPLNEDGPAPDSFEKTSRWRDSVKDMEAAAAALDDSIASNAQHPSQAAGITKARSSAQMSDLKGQMQDLKGKISPLKERPRADSLRRRSLQSLRTPSPFTAAPEQRYTGIALLQESQPEAALAETDGAVLTDGEVGDSNPERLLKDSGHASPVLEQNEDIVRNTQDVEQAHSSDPERGRKDIRFKDLYRSLENRREQVRIVRREFGRFEGKWR